MDSILLLDKYASPCLYNLPNYIQDILVYNDVRFPLIYLQHSSCTCLYAKQYSMLIYAKFDASILSGHFRLGASRVWSVSSSVFRHDVACVLTCRELCHSILSCSRIFRLQPGNYQFQLVSCTVLCFHARSLPKTFVRIKH